MPLEDVARDEVHRRPLERQARCLRVEALGHGGARPPRKVVGARRRQPLGSPASEATAAEAATARALGRGHERSLVFVILHDPARAFATFTKASKVEVSVVEGPRGELGVHLGLHFQHCVHVVVVRRATPHRTLGPLLATVSSRSRRRHSPLGSTFARRNGRH